MLFFVPLFYVILYHVIFNRYIKMRFSYIEVCVDAKIEIEYKNS